MVLPVDDIEADLKKLAQTPFFIADAADIKAAIQYSAMAPAASNGPIVTNATATATTTATPSPNINTSPYPFVQRSIFTDVLSVSVGAFAGVSIAATGTALLGQTQNNTVLALSGGAGAVIGSLLNGFLDIKPNTTIVLDNAFVGASGAVIGYAVGAYINNQYIGASEAKETRADNAGQATSLSGVLSNAGFSALGAGAAVSIIELNRRI